MLFYFLLINKFICASIGIGFCTKNSGSLTKGEKMNKIDTWSHILRASLRKRLRIYGDIFDKQIKKLEHRGVPPNILSMLISKKTLVIHTLFKEAKRLAVFVDDKSNFTPFFLPVISRKQLTLYSQMQMIYLESDRKGMVGSQFDVNIPNRQLMYQEPYYVLGVRPNFFEREVKVINRHVELNGSPFLVEEIISLCLHTNLLNEYSVVSLGFGNVFYCHVKMVGGVPILNLLGAYDRVSNVCFPSCVLRV